VAAPLLSLAPLAAPLTLAVLLLLRLALSVAMGVVVLPLGPLEPPRASFLSTLMSPYALSTGGLLALSAVGTLAAFVQ